MHSKTKTEESSIILIASSNKDTASQNIAKHILMLHPFKQTCEQFQDNPIHQTEIHNRKVQLVTLNQELVHAQNITDSFTNPELVIFISKHSSTSGKPTLSVHTPGNIADAQLGGIPRKVSISPANPMRTCLQAMTKATKNQKLDYEVSYEGTHHGPSLDVPTMFAELGSSPPQWNDTNVAKAVAQAVIETISAFNEKPVETVLGIGGPHYNAKFTRMALEDEVAFGHMIPKYAVSAIDSTILNQCIQRTMEKVTRIILDWKGIQGQDKQPVVQTLGRQNLPFEKI